MNLFHAFRSSSEHETSLFHGYRYITIVPIYWSRLASMCITHTHTYTARVSINYWDISHLERRVCGRVNAHVHVHRRDVIRGAFMRARHSVQPAYNVKRDRHQVPPPPSYALCVTTMRGRLPSQIHLSVGTHATKVPATD